MHRITRVNPFVRVYRSALRHLGLTSTGQHHIGRAGAVLAVVLIDALTQ